MVSANNKLHLECITKCYKPTVVAEDWVDSCLIFVAMKMGEGGGGKRVEKEGVKRKYSTLNINLGNLEKVKK